MSPSEGNTNSMPPNALSQQESAIEHLSSYSILNRTWTPVKKTKRYLWCRIASDLFYLNRFKLRYTKTNAEETHCCQGETVLWEKLESTLGWMTYIDLYNWELKLMGTGSKLAISLKISDSWLLRWRAASRDFSILFSLFLERNWVVVDIGRSFWKY